MKTIVRLAAVILAIGSIGLGACGKTTAASVVYDAVAMPANATVPADAVAFIGNTFDILELGAFAFAKYCVDNGNTPAPCAVKNRRIISQAVRTGRAARNTAEYAVNNGQPVGVGVYNAIVDAVHALQSSPAQQFATQGGVQ
jgi:hypothetical protein